MEKENEAAESKGWPPLRVLVARLLDRAMGHKWFTLGVSAFLLFYAWDHGWHTNLIETLQALPAVGPIVAGIFG